MAKTRVYKTTNLGNGYKVRTSMSQGEYATYSLLGSIFAIIVMLVKWVIKFYISPIFFLIWLVKSLMHKKKEQIDVWVICGGVLCVVVVLGIVAGVFQSIFQH